LSKVVKRRTDVAGGVFPNPQALLTLAGAVMVEARDEGQAPAPATYPTMALLAAPPPARHRVVS
jgi:putative transposase